MSTNTVRCADRCKFIAVVISYFLLVFFLIAVLIYAALILNGALEYD